MRQVAHTCYATGNSIVTQLCESIMTEVFETASVQDTVQRAAAIMRDRNVRFVPVLGPTGLVGTISDRDIVVHLVAGGLGSETPVGTILPQRTVVTVMPEDSVQTAWKKMNNGGVNRVLVVGRHGMVMGAISRGDLVNLQRTRRNTTKKVSAESARRHSTRRTNPPA